MCLDPDSGKARRLTLVLPSDQWRVNARWINPSDYIQYANISNDGKSVVLTARGDLFHLQISDKETRARNLSQSAGTRESYAAFLRMVKPSLFSPTKTETTNCFTQKVDGGPWSQLTNTLDRTVYYLSWSPTARRSCLAIRF